MVFIESLTFDTKKFFGNYKIRRQTFDLQCCSRQALKLLATFILLKVLFMWLEGYRGSILKLYFCTPSILKVIGGGR